MSTTTNFFIGFLLLLLCPKPKSTKSKTINSDLIFDDDLVFDKPTDIDLSVKPKPIKIVEKIVLNEDVSFNHELFQRKNDSIKPIVSSTKTEYFVKPDLSNKDKKKYGIPLETYDIDSFKNKSVHLLKTVI